MADELPVGAFLTPAEFYARFAIPNSCRSWNYYRVTDGTAWRHGWIDAGGWGYVRVQ